MVLDRYTPTEIADGEAALAQVLAFMKKHGLTGQPPFGACLDDRWKYYGPQNYKAFVVTARNGGWVADVLLRTVPDGSPDVMGTPEFLPFPTYDQAFAAGMMILARLLAVAQDPTPSEV